MGILRRLREWREDKNGTLIGPNIDADSVDAGSVNTGDLDRGNGDLLTDASDWAITSFPLINDPAATSSSTYDEIAEIIGGMDQRRVPDGAEIWGNFSVRVDSVTAGETGNLRPVLTEYEIGGGSTARPLDELELTVTDSEDGLVVESGWMSLEDTLNLDLISGRRIDAKTTGGTLSVRDRRNTAGLMIAWRVK